MKRQFLLLAVVFGWCVQLAPAADWPQWRGPERTGLSAEKGLLAEWPKEGPKLVWQAKDIGDGYSTPAIVGDRLYLISNKGMDNEFVEARTCKDSTPVWSTTIGKVGVNRGPQYPGSRSTPTVDGKFLYALGSDGDLVSLDVAKGEIRWKKNLRSDFGGKPGQWAYSESPLVDGDVLVCTPGGSDATLVALDKNTGEVIWKSAVPGGDEAAYASAIVVDAGGAKQYVQFLQKGLVGVDAKTGKFLWRYDRTAEGSPANIPTPVARDAFVYSAAGRSGGGLVQLTAEGDKVEAKQVYFTPRLPSSIGGAVLVNGFLYGTNSQGMMCAEFSTGDLKWQERGIGAGAVCYADGRLYLHGEKGDVALIEASSDGYHEKGRFSLPDQPERGKSQAWAYPVIADGRLYLRDLGVLWCYNVQAGGSAAVSATKTAADASKREYPTGPKADVVEDYHGTKVPDPYRPLEDPDSKETRAWVEAENKITFGFLESIPARRQLKERLTKLWDYEKFSVPFKEGPRYFYSRNSGLQNQNVLYTTDSLTGTPKVLLDPNTLSADGTVALSGMSISDDGKLLAYALAGAGSDWITWRVRDVESGKDRDDLIEWSKFSGAAWTKDGSGFFYARYPEPKPGEDLRALNYFQKLYFHKLGTKQAEDKLVYERPDHKEWKFGSLVTDDGKYLVVDVSKSTDDVNRVLYKELDKPDAPLVELIDNFDGGYELIDNIGPVLYFKTNKNAPRSRVIAIDTRKPAEANWREVIPQGEFPLAAISLVGERFFASYLKDAHTQVKVFDMDGKYLSEVKFPGLGTVVGFGGKRDDKETFYSYASFTTPASIYRYDVASGQSTVYRAPKVGFNPDDYVTEQVFYSSKDGTRVPMFISYKKGLKKNGEAQAYLFGYGGFNIALTPAFSVSNLVWMEMGGVFALPNLRGGGEYGEEWHKAGTKLQKQNVFDDFISAAEWLIANKYTTSAKLAIGGGSNGGLLVGACLTQRPDLYGATLPAVGVLDMLRFHKFTIGHAWVDDYGSSDDAAEFQALVKYSPLHAIKPGTCYPPTMITTADHDDRVVPAHSFKFAATLQAAQGCDNPILIRIETKAGHGAGKPTAKIIEEAADKWAFLVKVLGIEVPK